MNSVPEDNNLGWPPTATVHASTDRRGLHHMASNLQSLHVIMWGVPLLQMTAVFENKGQGCCSAAKLFDDTNTKVYSR